MVIHIVDNKIEHISSLKKMLIEDFSERHIGVNISIFTNVHVYLTRLKEQHADIALIDIQLPERSGIELAAYIRDISIKTRIVFVTAYASYSEDIFGSDPTSFLLKPVKRDKLHKAIDLALNELSNIQKHELIFTNNRMTIRLSTDAIIIIEGRGRQVAICTRDNEYTTYVKMDKIYSKLPTSFIQCHQSYIVNMGHIARINGQSIYMSNGVIVPISQRYRQITKAHFLKYIGGWT